MGFDVGLTICLIALARVDCVYLRLDLGLFVLYNSVGLFCLMLVFSLFYC